MYRCVKDFEIRFTDVDAYDNLKLSSLLCFLEEISCVSADDLGLGYNDLKPKNIGFILSNWYIELNRAIRLGEKVTLRTWPIKPKYLIFLRDFEIYCGEEKVGAATSRWCMVDLNSFSVLPVSAGCKDNDFDRYDTQRSVSFANWKIPAIEDGEYRYSMVALYSDYDHYFHVNNTKYADFLMDAFTVEELDGKLPHTVQITYVKQCKQGDRLDFTRKADGEYFLVEGAVGGETRVRMRIKFNGV